MKKLQLISISAVFLLLFGGCTCWNCGCDNVDDCLSKYKFEEARKYASKLKECHGIYFSECREKSMYKIMISESEYWISQNELEKAKNIAKELITNYGEDGEKKYFALLLGIIKKYCQKQQFDPANELANELPEKIVKNITKIDITGRGGTDPDSYCKINYQRIKANLKLNEEIESFRGCDFNYKITTWEFPRMEALKIIEDFKKPK